MIAVHDVDGYFCQHAAMNIIARTLVAVGLLLSLLMVANAQGAAVQVRDSQDGHFLDAEFAIVVDSQTAQWGELNRLSLAALLNSAAVACDVRDARCLLPLLVRADGYAELRTQVDPTNQPALQIWLDPLDRKGADGSSSNRLVGYLYRSATRQPAANLRLTLGDLSTLSDAAGRFDFDLDTQNLSPAGTSARLRVFGEQTLLLSRELLLVAGNTKLILDLDLDVGLQAPDHRQLSGQLQLELPAAPHVEAASGLRAPVLAPPSSIRVGYADAGFTTLCCVGGCAAVSTMSLETYVRRGLNDEWIASWTEDSLRSGALAYRSYGAWHVLNPRSPNYDICSSACCQVNDADTHVRTDAAVAATVGLMLSAAETPFRSEYSAENNAWDDPNDGLPCANVDLSCGNGFVGSPAADWPCMADLVATDRGCFGHGRGMSQWGTQRWSNDQGRHWPWIVDHYYSDNGDSTGAGSGLRQSIISSPLRINSLAPLAPARPGETLKLVAQMSNLAAETHARVYIGASLFRQGQGFIDDSDNDQQISLPPGDHQRQRDFALPADLAPGVYDVLLSLYLDVDSNQMINSGDLALILERYEDALVITAAPLFSDGFEDLP